MFGASIGAREQRIFSGKCDRSDGSFDNVVVEFDAAVIDEPCQPLPTRERVADSVGKLDLL